MESDNRKQAAKVSLVNVLKKHEKINSEISGTENISEDAFRDGKSGVVGRVLDMVNPVHYLKSLLTKLVMAVGPVIIGYMIITIAVMVVVVSLYDVLMQLDEVGNAINNFINRIFINEDYIDEYMSEEDIDEIVDAIDCTEKQEKVIRFALSRVGYPYSQEQRTSGEYYDCSSLVFYAWTAADEDISFGSWYPPTAADEAKLMKEHGKRVDTRQNDFELQPGDLLFYGGSSNGRYLGIDHVAIYIGNGMMVEAYNEDAGIIYRKVRIERVIMVGRM